MSKDNGHAANGREERLQIMLSPSELEAVDNFRFQHRMPSRAAAVRELFRLGLAAMDSNISAPGSKSSQYGVIRPKSPRAGYANNSKDDY